MHRSQPRLSKWWQHQRPYRAPIDVILGIVLLNFSLIVVSPPSCKRRQAPPPRSVAQIQCQPQLALCPQPGHDNDGGYSKPPKMHHLVKNQWLFQQRPLGLVSWLVVQRDFLDSRHAPEAAMVVVAGKDHLTSSQIKIFHY